MSAERVDVVVIGGGPAGATAAAELRALGASVVVIAGQERAPSGETLSELAQPLLRRLGLTGHLGSAVHAPSLGRRSWWGSAGAQEMSAMMNPYGGGWRLDRRALNAALRDVAIASGAGWLSGFARIERAGGWRVEVRGSPTYTFEGDLLLDCSGRRSIVARSQGVGRTRWDRLVAVGVLAQPGRAVNEDHLVTVEATEHGWWYSVSEPGGGRFMSFHSDGDLVDIHAARTAVGWRRLLSQAPNMNDLWERGGYRMLELPQAALADSSRLDFVAGDLWAAVGDAAAAYDPLSSQGIVAAMDAGRRIARHLMCWPSERGAYEASIDATFARYLDERRRVYSAEQRWPHAPFWGRRTSGSPHQRVGSARRRPTARR